MSQSVDKPHTIRNGAVACPILLQFDGKVGELGFHAQIIEAQAPTLDLDDPHSTIDAGVIVAAHPAYMDFPSLYLCESVAGQERAAPVQQK